MSGPWSMAAWTSWDEEEMEEFNGQMRSTDENSAELPDSKVPSRHRDSLDTTDSLLWD